MRNIMTMREYYNLSPDDVQPDMAVVCKVAAVVGYAGDWAAYRSPSDVSDEEAVMHGDKLTRAAAEGIFPTFRNAGLRYRG